MTDSAPESVANPESERVVAESEARVVAPVTYRLLEMDSLVVDELASVVCPAT